MCCCWWFKSGLVTGPSSAQNMWSSVLAVPVGSAGSPATGDDSVEHTLSSRAEETRDDEEGAETGLDKDNLFAALSSAPKGKKRGRPKNRLSELLQSLPTPVPRQAGDESVVGSIVVAHTASSTSIALPVAPVVHIKLGMLGELRAKSGRMALPAELLNVCKQVQVYAGQTSEIQDAVVKDLSDFYMQAYEYHIASSIMLGRLCQTSPDMLQQKTRRLASMLFLSQVLARHELEKNLMQQIPVQSRFFYMDYWTYDETPMKVRLQERFVEQIAGPKLDQEDLLTLGGVPVVDVDSSQVVIAKILQMRSAFGMILRLSQGLVAFQGEHVPPLHSLGANTGAILAEALCKHNPMTEFADQFASKLRSSCADGLGANRTAEQLVASHRRGWAICQWTCEVHMVAGAHGKAFNGLFASDVRGLLHLSLSLRTAGCWHTFKQALMAEMSAREVVVMEGSCTEQQHMFKLMLLTMFYQGESKNVEAMLRLLSGLNGNWSSTTLELYWDSDSGHARPSREEALQSMCECVLQTLGAKRPRLYPQHRWTGFREALRDVAMLGLVHSLLSGAYA
eukprot:6492226-Amphidinium_carterae.1